MDAMRELHNKTGYVLEPHAAIAWKVLSSHLKEDETGIFLGTAHPAKFKADVDKVLDIDVSLPDALEKRKNLDSKSVTLDPDYSKLKNYVLKELNL